VGGGFGLFVFVVWGVGWGGGFLVGVLGGLGFCWLFFFLFFFLLWGAGGVFFFFVFLWGWVVFCWGLVGGGFVVCGGFCFFWVGGCVGVFFFVCLGGVGVGFGGGGFCFGFGLGLWGFRQNVTLPTAELLSRYGSPFFFLVGKKKRLFYVFL